MVDRIKEKLESATAAFRAAEQRIAQYRAALDRETALLLETSGKIKGYQELLSLSESKPESTAEASAATMDEPAGGES